MGQRGTRDIPVILHSEDGWLFELLIQIRTHIPMKIQIQTQIQNCSQMYLRSEQKDRRFNQHKSLPATFTQHLFIWTRTELDQQIYSSHPEILGRVGSLEYVSSFSEALRLYLCNGSEVFFLEQYFFSGRLNLQENATLSDDARYI